MIVAMARCILLTALAVRRAWRFAFAGGDETSKKRVAAVAKPQATARGRTRAAGRRRPEAQERRRPCSRTWRSNSAAKKEKPTMRRRLEQAAFPRPRRAASGSLCGIAGRWRRPRLPAHPPEAAGDRCWRRSCVGLGLPRWVLGFLTDRRKKKFTDEFANAIDVIVRSVKLRPSHQRSAAHRGARSRPIRWAANSTIWWKA